MSFEYEHQKAYAQFLHRNGVMSDLMLVKVTYKDVPNGRISVVGHAISPACMEIWERQGATVEVLEVIKKEIVK
jgi:L-serine deaminase